MSDLLPVKTEDLPRATRTVLKRVLADITDTPYMDRAAEFEGGVMAATMATLAADTEARMVVDDALETDFSKRLPNTPVRIPVENVIIGGGLHAAIYAAVTTRLTGVRPVVLEARRVGGAFACSRRPAFYLNSPNRPGPLTIPGDPKGSLNYMPGALAQLSDIPGGQYHTNDDLAWLIRMTLAATADVYRATVTTVDATDAKTTVVVADGGRRISAKRVIDATGLGYVTKQTANPRLLTFEEFMARMDSSMPLEGMRRVAVIGGGDSGRAVIQAICGQGPVRMIASLDYPSVTWFGGFGFPITAERWVGCNRSRYKEIAALFGRQVTPMDVNVSTVASDFDGVVVDDRGRFDYVVDCRERNKEPIRGLETLTQRVYDDSRTRILALRYRTPEREIYRVGPWARLERDNTDIFRSDIPESTTAMYRYAGRTALLAAMNARSS